MLGAFEKMKLQPRAAQIRKNQPYPVMLKITKVVISRDGHFVSFLCN